MPLSRAADGGVTGHITDGVKIDGEYRYAQTQPCGGKRRLDSGMTRTDDGNVIAFR